MDKPSARAARRVRGLVVYVVAMILVILGLGGMAMLFYVRTELEAAAARTLELQLANTTRSAVALIQSTVELSPSRRDSSGGIYDNPQHFAAQVVLSEEQGGRDETRFTVLAPEFRGERIDGIRFGLANESAKLNLAAVLQWESERPGSGIAALKKLPGMTTTQAESILDWLDPDETARANGAEFSWYAAKGLPYSPRGDVPVFLEEILLVRDVTRLQLYGDDDMFNYGDIASKKDITSLTDVVPQMPNDRSAPIPWARLLTVFSAEKDVNPDGLARIDLNSNDLEFLHQELEAALGRTWADFVILYRQFGRTAKVAASADTEKAEMPEATLDFTVKGTTKLRSPLDLLSVTLRVPARVFESETTDTPKANRVITSPICGEPKADDLFKLLDYVSVGASTTIVGRVNINEAPRPVLLAIPGLTVTQVDRIVASRPAPVSERADDFRHASWLYTSGIVDLATMKYLYNKVTTGGDVFGAQIVAFAPARGAFNRAEVVVDASVSPPRQVFYKDLTEYGQGFPQSVLNGNKE